MLGLLAVVFGSHVFGIHALAQETGSPSLPELVTDRPGFTEPTDLVGPGTVQTENGFGFDWGGDGSRLLTAGATLIRFGVSQHLELRLVTDGYLAASEPGARGTALPRTLRHGGMADGSLGAKVGILEETRFRPALSILPSLSLPSGGSAFSSRAYDPQINVSWSKNVPWGFNVGGNAAAAANTDGASRLLERAFSVSASHDLPRGFNGYGEVFTVRSNGADAAPFSVVNGGVTHLLGVNVQVDIEAGWAVAGPGPRLFLAGGLVIRRPGLFPRWFKAK